MKGIEQKIIVIDICNTIKSAENYEKQYHKL